MPKQLILDFYDVKIDSFVVVVFFFVFFCFVFLLKNKLWVHPQSIFEHKSEKECIPLSEPQSFYMKVWYMRWSKLHSVFS